MKANRPTKEHRRKVAKRTHIDKAMIRMLISVRDAKKWIGSEGTT